MKRLFGIYGSGGCGRGIMPIAREQLKSAAAEKYELVFVDDRRQGESCNGHDVVSFDKFIAEKAHHKRLAVAIADTGVRQEVVSKCEKANISFFDVVAPTHVRMDEVIVGQGAVISPYTVFTSNIRIGRHFHANIYSYVEHDCVVGDFVTFAPSVRCNGNIVIEDNVYVGAGAVIRQGRHGQPLRVGAGATIGMGAVVTKDVSAGSTVVGNPARPFSA